MASADVLHLARPKATPKSSAAPSPAHSTARAATATGDVRQNTSVPATWTSAYSSGPCSSSCLLPVLCTADRDTSEQSATANPGVDAIPYCHTICKRPEVHLDKVYRQVRENHTGQ